MKKVWLVTEGSYSDYRILAVYDNEADANKLENARGYEAGVEEWEVNSLPTRLFTEWKIYFDADFNHYKTSGCPGQLYHSPQLTKGGRFSAFPYWVLVCHDDKRTAEKIAYDTIAKFRAEKEGL